MNLDVMNAQTNMTNRRLLNITAETRLTGCNCHLRSWVNFLGSSPVKAPTGPKDNPSARVKTNPLKPPTQGAYPLPFLFRKAHNNRFHRTLGSFSKMSWFPVRTDHPFHLYTVSESTSPIHASGGMKIVPDYTFGNAPAPKESLFPARVSQVRRRWNGFVKSTKSTERDHVGWHWRICAGKDRLLSGKAATTFHGAFVPFANEFPDIHLSASRFVEDGNLPARADFPPALIFALRVVERYFGPRVAEKTAYNMEYQGLGWMNPMGNQVYAATPSFHG